MPPFSNAESLNKVCHLIKEMAEGGTGQLSFFHVLGSPVMIQRAEAAGGPREVSIPFRVEKRPPSPDPEEFMKLLGGLRPVEHSTGVTIRNHGAQSEIL